jgi:hypothetical protein
MLIDNLAKQGIKLKCNNCNSMWMGELIDFISVNIV